jgi:hypothetical protein
VRHADYIGSWLEVLREDNRAIVRAASQASKAADWLHCPGAVTVHGQASCKTCTGRDAYRRWRIGGGEADTACGKRVQRRCADNRVSGIPGDLSVVFVGHEDKQILRRGGHRRSFRCWWIVQPLPGSGSELCPLDGTPPHRQL